mmetsp:Transcript_56403/g.181074  ORF Transcript_56403/g.181074 Transcript_56403/m.181074 type:complete len:241 (-) Transcript_56403:121-843(-)
MACRCPCQKRSSRPPLAPHPSRKPYVSGDGLTLPGRRGTRQRARPGQQATLQAPHNAPSVSRRQWLMMWAQCKCYQQEVLGAPPNLRCHQLHGSSRLVAQTASPSRTPRWSALGLCTAGWGDSWDPQRARSPGAIPCKPQCPPAPAVCTLPSRTSPARPEVLRARAPAPGTLAGSLGPKRICNELRPLRAGRSRSGAPPGVPGAGAQTPGTCRRCGSARRTSPAGSPRVPPAPRSRRAPH